MSSSPNVAAHGQGSATKSEDSSELRELLDAQQRAILSGDSTAVAASSEALTNAALKEIGQIRRSLQHAGAAAPQTLKIRERQPKKVLGDGFNDWGTAEARQRRYADALAHFQQAEHWDAATSGLMRNLGTAAFEVENYSEAVRALSTAVNGNQQDSRLRMMLAMSLFSLERFEEAAKQFAQVSDLAMQDERTAYAWAYSLVRTNQPRQANAIADILQGRQLAPEAHLLVCKLYTASENYEHAIPCFRALAEANPEMAEVHYEWGATLIRLDKPSEAIPELRTELTINPRDLDAQYDLAYALLETSQREEAITLLRSVLAINPKYAQAQYQLGKVLLEQANVDEAIPHLEAAAKLNAKDDFVHYQLQVAYRRAGRTEDANRELERYKQLKAEKRERATAKMAHETPK
jgi:Flp pilus assembly protein TadD